MQFSIAFASLLAFVGAAAAQGTSCPQAARFGNHKIVPTILTIGQTFTITSNFTCSFSTGVRPSEVDYILRNTVNNNGHEPPIVLARRYNPTVIDTFSATLPAYTYFQGASYTIQTLLTFPDGAAQTQGFTNDIPVTVTPNA